MPTLAVSELTTNAAAIWSAISEERTPPPAERLPAVAAMRVWRSGLSPKFRSIGAFEQRAIALARMGQGFARLCDLLADDAGEEAAPRLGAVLAGWIGDGMIASIRD